MSSASNEWIVWGTVGAFAVAAWAAWLKPLLVRARLVWRQKRNERLFLHGSDGVSGMSDPVASAAARTLLLEKNVTTILGDVSTIKSEMVKVKDAAGEASVGLAVVMRNLDEFRKEFSAFRAEQTPNGEDTNNIGDLTKRMARKMDVVVDEDVT